MVKKSEIDNIKLVRGSKLPDGVYDFYCRLLSFLETTVDSPVQLMETCTNLFLMSLQNDQLDRESKEIAIKSALRSLNYLSEHLNKGEPKDVTEKVVYSDIPDDVH